MPITTLKEMLIAHLGTRYVKTGQGARSTFFGIDIMQDVDGHYIYEFVIGGGRFKSAHEDWSPITYSVVQGLVEQAESTHPTPPPARRWVTCSEGVSKLSGRRGVSGTRALDDPIKSLRPRRLLPRPRRDRRPGWLTVINSTEAYPTTDRISWAHSENKYKNHVFADEVRNSDTFNEGYFGCVVVKEDKRSGCHGAAAIIMCFKAGQIALGAPGVRTKSNGEVRLCHNLNLHLRVCRWWRAVQIST